VEPKDLTRLFEINAYVVKENTKELTHEDSLILPHPGGNCLNWVMGHIVASRNLILNLVGKQPIWSEEETKPYTRGSEPLAKGDDARQFDSILADFAKSQEQIMGALSNLTSDELAKAADEKETVGEKLSFLHFHETYHLGQIGLLRRLAGKAGVIK